MELSDGDVDIVHPEVRAHINSLVSALGGVSADDEQQYQLGDDALEVLRDIKQWIRFYDEKTNRMDVARCILDANLIEGDLIPILAKWREDALDSRFKNRIVVSCLEILAPLTWPIDQDKEKMTVNHHRHIPVLELAQLQYKSAIINFDSARLLNTAVRAAFPSMAIPINDRTPRDQGIIKLALFFLRNIAIITPAQGVKFNGDDSQISRSATIDAFSYQEVFAILLTIASGMGEDFKTEDATVMEILYHLVKQVNIDKLFMDDKQLSATQANELAALMKKESAMLLSQNRNRPTRHSRFGTMVWVKRSDGKVLSLAGQEALGSAASRNKKLDDDKTFRPARRNRKENRNEKDLGVATSLTESATRQLRIFVEEFLDSGFNPLFQHIRRSIDREASHIMHYHRRQFFYLVSWFLQAERLRRKRAKAAKTAGNDEVGSFNLVAAVLNQEMFITLTKGLHDSYDYKDWQTLSAAMRCFTQILLTIQEMADQGTEDDQDIAENVLSRLFYEESTHDVIANIARTYKVQDFEYLDATTELVHHFLRTLEAYSKQNADMQIRSRRRARQRKRADRRPDTEEADEEDIGGSDQDGAAVERTSKERKFDFSRFRSKFTPQGVVNTFVAFAKYYQDLDDSQLKRAHRYFYKLAFEQELSVMLFRVDILHLLFNMIKGPESLEASSKILGDWELLIRKIFRKCFKKIDERPEIIVEMLFSKLPSTAFFLEYGYQKQTMTVGNQARPAAELVFKHTAEHDQQVGIAVAALLDRNETDHVQWLKTILTTAEIERRSWSATNDTSLEGETLFDDAEFPGLPQQSALPPVFTARPDNDERRKAMFKNPYLRLLMKLAGFALLDPASEESSESVWVLPPNIAANELKDTLHFIGQAEFNPPSFENGSSAEQQLKRKTAPRKKAAFDDDDEAVDNLGDFLDDDILFPAGGPTERKAIDEDKGTKKSRRKRQNASQEPDDENRRDQARKRRDREREKALRIKSSLYVKIGDDEFDSDEDEAFFARERVIKARAEQAARSAIPGLRNDDDSAVGSTASKRKSAALLEISSDDDDENDEEDNVEDNDTQLSRHPASSQSVLLDTSQSDDTVLNAGDTERRKRRRVGVEMGNIGAEKAADSDDNDDGSERPVNATQGSFHESSADEAGAVPVSNGRRPRVRGGFVIDSDDDD